MNLLFLFKLRLILSSCSLAIAFSSLMIISISLINGVMSSSKILGEFTYEEGEWETMIVDLISREVAHLPIVDFVDDPELVLKVDRVNKLSVYSKLNSNKFKVGELKADEQEQELEASITYRRKSVDSKNPIVVLKSHEDHLKVFERKRTFVVLRQNPLTSYTYFASYVYLRFWTDKQQGCIETYLNEKICLEWDTWDNDRGEIKTKEKYFGWTDCASSFLFSCRFNSSADGGNVSKSLELVERGYRNTTMNYEQVSATKLTFVPAEEFPFDDTIDAFFDLETNAGEGHYIWETIRHSSIFNKPASLIETENAVSGRSFGLDSTKNMIQRINEVKEKAKEDVLTKSKLKTSLHKQLTTRAEWFQRKNTLSTLIRNYTKEMGFFEEFYKVKSDPLKLKQLKQYKDAEAIFKELDMLGDNFHVNVVIDKQVKTTGTDLKRKGNEVTLLAKADEKPEEDGLNDQMSLSAAFGRAISAIAIKSGGGMTGRSMGELDTKVAETIAKSVLFSSTDTFQVPGWKLQEGGGLNWKPNDTLLHEPWIFYGLGSCPFIKPNIENTNNTSATFDKKNKVVDFFLTILRTYCLKEAKEYLLHLIDGKYLNVIKSHFVVPQELFQSSKRKLRTNEFRKLSAALEIASFSQNYEDESRHDWNALNAAEVTSRSVHYLQEFGYLFITQARQVADQHFIKLCRNLVLTYKGVLTKLIQDHEILLSNCDKDIEACKWDFKLNYHDRLAIHSFMEFLTRGLAPVEHDSNASVEKLYKEFVQRNLKPIQDGIKFYQ